MTHIPNVWIFMVKTSLSFVSLSHNIYFGPHPLVEWAYNLCSTNYDDPPTLKVIYHPLYSMNKFVT